MSSRKLVYLSFFISIGIVLHIVEAFMPLTFVIPGAKLGLANIVTLIVVVIYGLADGLKVSIMRTVLGSLLSGTFMTVSFFLSFSGALISTIIMGIIFHYWSDYFSVIGVSILGAVSHNIAQLAAAYIIIEHTGIFYYLPYLLIFALPTGFFVGVVVFYTEKFFSIHSSLKDI